MTNLVFDGPLYQYILYELLNLDEQDTFDINKDFQVLQYTFIDLFNTFITNNMRPKFHHFGSFCTTAV